MSRCASEAHIESYPKPVCMYEDENGECTSNLTSEDFCIYKRDSSCDRKNTQAACRHKHEWVYFGEKLRKCVYCNYAQGNSNEKKGWVNLEWLGHTTHDGMFWWNLWWNKKTFRSKIFYKFLEKS